MSFSVVFKILDDVGLPLYKKGFEGKQFNLIILGYEFDDCLPDLMDVLLLLLQIICSLTS